MWPLSSRSAPTSSPRAHRLITLVTSIEPNPPEKPEPAVVAIDDVDVAKAAARSAADKLAADTVIIDVGDVIAITGYFVITSGASRRQVRAIVDEVEVGVIAAGGPKPIRVEGIDHYEWVLMDFGDVVVHVFAEEQREYYQLERLWSDRPRVPWAE